MDNTYLCICKGFHLGRPLELFHHREIGRYIIFLSHRHGNITFITFAHLTQLAIFLCLFSYLSLHLLLLIIISYIFICLFSYIALPLLLLFSPPSPILHLLLFILEEIICLTHGNIGFISVDLIQI